MYPGDDIDKRLDHAETAPHKATVRAQGSSTSLRASPARVEGRLGAGAEDAVDGGLELAGGFGEAGVDARHGGLVGLEAALEEIGLPLGL